MNGYILIRDWYNFKFANPSKAKAVHSDMYCYLVDLWNRLGQKPEFGLPTSVAMESLGIGSYNTYKKTLNDLIEFGFIRIVADSKNQHQSKIIALSKNDKATDKALDEATAKATDKPTDTIIEQKNNRIKERSLLFDKFWKMYGKSSDKKKCKDKFMLLSDKEIDLIFETLPIYLLKTPDVTYRKNPLTYINGKCWNDIDLNNPQIPTNPYNLPPVVWEG
jgi:hypothetical protein